MSLEHLQSLEDVARAMVAPGKGILAADESDGTIKKRFDNIAVDSTEENRRGYRDLLFTTPQAEQYISGVILFDETIRQESADGTPFPDLLSSRGIIPGIKVDKGAKPLAAAPSETVTEGLDGLRARLEDYRGLGARFAKWRAVLAIGDGLPSDYAIETNAHALARYAALCVEQDIVPIVEPEVLMDGSHDLDACYSATERTLRRLFACLDEQRVPIPQIVLKPNMVLSGSTCTKQASDEDVARKTVGCFSNVLPDNLPGVVFLSGGQTEVEATYRLHLMNTAADGPKWPLSFSYGRALQASALAAWRGQSENLVAAQQAFLARAAMNSAATKGEYSSADDPQAKAS